MLINLVSMAFALGALWLVLLSGYGGWFRISTISTLLDKDFELLAQVSECLDIMAQALGFHARCQGSMRSAWVVLRFHAPCQGSMRNARVPREVPVFHSQC